MTGKEKMNVNPRRFAHFARLSPTSAAAPMGAKADDTTNRNEEEDDTSDKLKRARKKADQIDDTDNDADDDEARIRSMLRSDDLHVRAAGHVLRAAAEARGDARSSDYTFRSGQLPKTVNNHDPRDVARAVLDAAARARGER
jgi:hypothetical protein